VPRSHVDLPSLTGTYPVGDEQADQYRRSGHIVLRHVASPAEIGTYREVVREAVLRWPVETRPLEERDTYGKAFLQVTNLWERDEAVRRFVLSPRFGRIAADLMGVPAVRLYHDQALFKEPGGGPTPWHQDQFYWPLDTPNTITLWMPMVDVPPEVGSMTFATGSHTTQYHGYIVISDESEVQLAKIISQSGLPQ